jgi:hypothetical protein
MASVSKRVASSIAAQAAPGDSDGASLTLRVSFTLPNAAPGAPEKISVPSGNISKCLSIKPPDRMQNAKCRMHNECICFADDFNLSRSDTFI